jgi:CAAX protease family protein
VATDLSRRGRVSRPASPTVIGLLIALGGPPLFATLPDFMFGDAPSAGTLIVLQLLFCGLAGAIGWIVVRGERLPLQSIGLPPRGWSTLGFGVVFYSAISAVGWLTHPLVQAVGTEGVDAEVRRLALQPLWFRIVEGATGGFVEETLYRGYAVERLSSLTGRAWIGGALSALAFGAAHIPRWGLGFALTADLPFGIVMTIFYLWRRDLLANALAHSTALVVAMVTVVR